MPPSGYSAHQSSSVCVFLKSCSQALERECHMKNEGLAHGLRREIDDIARYRSEHRLSVTQKAVLQLTSVFYEAVAQNVAAGACFADSVASVLANMEREILDIHIEPVPLAQ